MAAAKDNISKSVGDDLTQILAMIDEADKKTKRVDAFMNSDELAKQRAIEEDIRRRMAADSKARAAKAAVSAKSVTASAKATAATPMPVAGTGIAFDLKAFEELQKLQALQTQFDAEDRKKELEKKQRLAKEEAANQALLMGFKKQQLLEQQNRHLRVHQSDADEALILQLLEQEKRNALKEQEEAGASLALLMEQAGEHTLTEADILAQYQAANKRWEDKKPKACRKIDKDGKKQAEALKAAEAYKKEMLALLATVRSHPSVAGNPGSKELMDAHTYTRSYIQPTLPKLLQLDTHFNLSDPNLNPDVVLAEVKVFLETELANLNKISADALKSKNDQNHQAKMANIQKTFALIKGQGIDAETNANINQFVSRNWSLAKKLGRPYINAIASVFNDNIADQGGCTAGLIARLFATYVIDLVTLLAPTLNHIAEKQAAKSNSK